jgi:hypothetical protein
MMIFAVLAAFTSPRAPIMLTDRMENPWGGNVSGCEFYDTGRADATFNKPYGIGDGGAIYWTNGTSSISITECLFDGCWAYRGGGAYLTGRNVTVTLCTSINCSALASGAFIYCQTPTCGSYCLGSTSATASICATGTSYLAPDSEAPSHSANSFNSSFNVVTDSGSGLEAPGNLSSFSLELCSFQANQGNVLSLGTSSTHGTVTSFFIVDAGSCGFLLQTATLIYVNGPYMLVSGLFRNNSVRYTFGIGSDITASLILSNCAFDMPVMATGRTYLTISGSIAVDVAYPAPATCFLTPSEQFLVSSAVARSASLKATAVMLGTPGVGTSLTRETAIFRGSQQWVTTSGSAAVETGNVRNSVLFGSAKEAQSSLVASRWSPRSGLRGSET